MGRLNEKLGAAVVQKALQCFRNGIHMKLIPGGKLFYDHAAGKSTADTGRWISILNFTLHRYNIFLKSLAVACSEADHKNSLFLVHRIVLLNLVELLSASEQILYGQNQPWQTGITFGDFNMNQKEMSTRGSCGCLFYRRTVLSDGERNIVS